MLVKDAQKTYRMRNFKLTEIGQNPIKPSDEGIKVVKKLTRYANNLKRYREELGLSFQEMHFISTELANQAKEELGDRYRARTRSYIKNSGQFVLRNKEDGKAADFFYTVGKDTIAKAEHGYGITRVKALIILSVLNHVRQEKGMSPLALDDLELTYSQQKNQPSMQNKRLAAYDRLQARRQQRVQEKRRRAKKRAH